MVEDIQAPIILYDNPSRLGKGTCWTLNVWKSIYSALLPRIEASD